MNERSELDQALADRDHAREERDTVHAKALDRDEAYGYLSRLFLHLAPQCRCLETVAGLATQIDNYIAGCHADLKAAREELATLKAQSNQNATAAPLPAAVDPHLGDGKE